MKPINVDTVALMLIREGGSVNALEAVERFTEPRDGAVAVAMAASQVKDACKLLRDWGLVGFDQKDGRKVKWAALGFLKSVSLAEVKNFLFQYKYGKQTDKLTDPKQIVKVTGLDLAELGPPPELGECPEGVRPSEHLIAKSLPFAEVYGGPVDAFPRPLDPTEREFIIENYTGLGIEDYEFGTLLRDEVGNVYIEITRGDKAMSLEGRLAWAIATAKTAAAMTWCADYSELCRPQVLRVLDHPAHICIMLCSVKGYGEPALYQGWESDRIDDIVRDAEEVEFLNVNCKLCSTKFTAEKDVPKKCPKCRNTMQVMFEEVMDEPASE